MDLGRAETSHGRDRGGPEGAGCGTGGPGRGLPAQPARDGRRVLRGGFPGRGVVLLLTGFRGTQCHRPVHTDRTEGAADRGRLPLRRQGLRPPRGRGGTTVGTVQRGTHRSPRPPDPRKNDGGHSFLGRPGTFRGGGRAGVHPRALRPPPLGAVLLGDDRSAQGHRAQPRRHPPGAAQEPAPARGRTAGGPGVLVHHHRVDDVELPGQCPADPSLHRPVRRKPGPPVTHHHPQGSAFGRRPPPVTHHQA